LVLLSACTAHAASGPLLMPVDATWKLESTGAWVAERDHRGLFVMRHPARAAVARQHALVWAMHTVPEDWTGAVELAFYCADDIQLAGESPLAEKRFKQILVDSDVVWSEDVGDAGAPGTAALRRIALKVTPGQTFRLGLLAYDQGDTELPFATQLYWGDLQLVSPETPLAPGKRPAEAMVAERHAKRSTAPPGQASNAKFEARFRLLAGEGIPKPGFPLSMGVPIARGAGVAPESLRLFAGNREVPSQIEVTGVWPDDSPRWLFVDALVPPDTPEVVLRSAPRKASTAASTTKIVERDDGLVLTAGPLSVRVAGPQVLGGIALGETPLIRGAELSLESTQGRAAGVLSTAGAVCAGPVRGTASLTGDLEGEAETYGHFDLYVSFFNQISLLKLELRFTNSFQKPLQTNKLTLAFEFTEELKNPTIDHSPPLPLPSLVAITEWQKSTLNDARHSASGPLVAGWDGGAVALPWFRERSPKSLRLLPNALQIALIDAPTRPVSIAPGESVSQEVWLWLGKEANARTLGTMLAEAPLLDNPEYFAASGAFGPAGTGARAPWLAEALEGAYGNRSWEALGHAHGLRDFPDRPYVGPPGSWSNNANDALQGAWNAWLTVGGRAWFDRARTYGTFVQDVVAIRADIPGGDLAGSLRGPGPGHTAPPWPPTLRTESLEWYQKLTGTPGSRETFLDVWAWCSRTDAGIAEASARAHAGPLDALCTAFSETGEITLLDDGAERIRAIWERVDRRRGAWCEANREQWATIPWQAAFLGRSLYRWYGLSGDLEAAQALVALADAIVAEHMPADAPPRFGGGRAEATEPVAFALLVAPLLHAAGELTGDALYTAKAQEALARVEATKSPGSVFDLWLNVPWLLHYQPLPTAGG